MKALVGITRIGEVADEAIGVQADEPLVGDVAAEAAVAHRPAEPLVPGLDEAATSGLGEVDPTEPGLEVAGLEATRLEQAEERPVDQERLEVNRPGFAGDSKL